MARWQVPDSPLRGPLVAEALRFAHRVKALGPIRSQHPCHITPAQGRGLVKMNVVLTSVRVSGS